MTLRDNGTVLLNRQEETFLQQLLSNTGMELWNSSCSHRIVLSHAGADIKACTYGDPLHGKEYQTIQGAINHILKEEEKNL